MKLKERAPTEADATRWVWEIIWETIWTSEIIASGRQNGPRQNDAATNLRVTLGGSLNATFRCLDLWCDLHRAICIGGNVNESPGIDYRLQPDCRRRRACLCGNYS